MWLDRQDCEQIHLNARQLLQESGVRVDDAGVVGMLQEAGATLGNGNRVHIPGDLIDWAIRQCPKTLRIADRRGHRIELGPEGGSAFLTGNALYVTRGAVRAELRAVDLAELARIVDSCRNIRANFHIYPIPLTCLGTH